MEELLTLFQIIMRSLWAVGFHLHSTSIPSAHEEKIIS